MSSAVTTIGPVGRIFLAIVSTVLVARLAEGQALNACDLDASGSVTSADVTLATNMILGSTACTANVIAPALCNVAMAQRVVNAIGATCVTGDVRQVQVSWTASSSPALVGYKIYRGTTSHGPYPTLLTSVPVATTTFMDISAPVGAIAYYVVTSVDSNGRESTKSTEVAVNVVAAIP